MTRRFRLVIVVVVAVLLLGGAGWYCLAAFTVANRTASQPSAVATQAPEPQGGLFGDEPRVVFRNTAIGEGYGAVASVPLENPGGVRSVSELTCDRVYASAQNVMCLRIDRGVVTTFTAELLDSAGTPLQTWPLPGMPSRTRISADGNLVAFSAFITAHSYATVGFSIGTQIAEIGGADSGTLEGFALSVDGVAVTAADRNIWGVTFTSDPNEFYATAASGARTWLVRGDRAARTLTAVRDTVECPSVSPDGRHLAYKKVVSTAPVTTWTVAVVDLATNEEVVLPEPRNVDDQVEWLDNETVLYGLQRADSPGDTDVWSAPRDGSAPATLYIEHAWSPSVVR